MLEVCRWWAGPAGKTPVCEYEGLLNQEVEEENLLAVNWM